MGGKSGSRRCRVAFSQAVKARERLGHLEQHTERLEDQRRQLLEELQPLEEEWEQLEMQVKALRELAEADSLRAKELFLAFLSSRSCLRAISHIFS